ncbi:MAG: Mov34/MPN/PAD-1 family protein [Thermoplasmatales archaeon]|nr:Mov34/MPN/PAD-1 family protein [Thermoplasmatales archaeon]
MKMVKIEREEKKERKIAPPPSQILFHYPKDDIKRLIGEIYRERNLEEIGFSRNEKQFDYPFLDELNFYIKNEAFKKMVFHSYEMAKEEKEAMGFIIGDLFYWEEEYTIAFDIITAPLDSSSFNVKFKRDAFGEIFDKLDEIKGDYIIVGWYHSHPGYSSFMSGTDLDTQKNYFNKRFHASIVIDPINKEARAFRIINEECFEIPYAIFK